MDQNRQCTQCGEELSDRARTRVCCKCLLIGARDQIVTSASGEEPPPSQEATAAYLDATMETPGRYTGQREHARGGMGRILIAYDEQLGREVAIKELLSGSSESPVELTEQAIRFVREARIAGRLEHPSIVAVHELGVRANGDLYYVMKNVKGVGFEEKIRSAGGLPERLTLLPHVLDVCQAIAYAHSRSVIHRDIKPANIMVGEFGETVVLDWGLATMSGQRKAEPDAGQGERNLTVGLDTGETSGGQILGTPSYMAPEQARGLTDEVDERTDVYALGALLYVTLTGLPPFQGANRQDIIDKVASSKPTPISDLEPDAPAELVAICERAMASAQDERYASAAELAEEIQRYLTGRLVAAHQYSFADYLRRFARRNKGILLTTATAGALVVFLAVTSYVRIVEERDTALIAQAETEEARIEAEKERQRAAQEAQTAERVNEFLANIFLVADPYSQTELVDHLGPRQNRAGEVTALEILDAGAKQVLASLEEEPLVQARLLLGIGKAYKNLGLPRTALPLVDKATETIQGLLSENDPKLLGALSLRAAVLHDVGNYDDSASIYQRLIRISEGVYGEESLEVALAKTNLADILRHQRNLDAAEDMARSALDVIRREYKRPGMLDAALGNLALVLERKGKPEAALEYYRETVSIQRAAVEKGADEIRLITGLGNLSCGLLRHGDYEDAANTHREAMAIVRGHLAVDHPIYQKIVGDYTFTLLAAKRFGEAEKLNRENLAECRKELGDEHPLVLEALADYGRTASNLRASGQYEAAERIFSDLLPLVEELYGTGHDFYPQCVLNLANAMADRADTLRNEGKLQQALVVYEEVLSQHTRAVELAPSPMYKNGLSFSYVEIGRVYEEAGRMEEAAAAWEKALTIIAHITSQLDVGKLPLRSRTAYLDTHAQALLELGRAHEAEPLVKELLDAGWRDPEFLRLCAENGIATVQTAKPGSN